jgi:ferritin-like protein
MAHDQYHEPLELISEETKNLHRGLVSLIEELEAVDWYQQRADACSDEELKQTLLHNKNEEIEHACMALEWLRRNSPKFDEQLRIYLFSEGPITTAEERATGGEPAAAGDGASPGGSSLGIGSMKGQE